MATSIKTRSNEGARVTINYSDSVNLVREKVQWSPKGVCLMTKWPFQIGAEVEFAFDHAGKRHCCTGVVVACREISSQPGFFETALYFVETPCTKLQKAACDCQLAESDYETPRNRVANGKR